MRHDVDDDVSRQPWPHASTSTPTLRRRGHRGADGAGRLVCSVLLTLTNDAVRTGGRELATAGHIPPSGGASDGCRAPIAPRQGRSRRASIHVSSHVFDAPDRDDRGWVLSVAHCDVVPADRLTRLRSGRRRSGRRVAAAQVRPRRDRRSRRRRAADGLSTEPDPAGLLEEPFTMRQLRALHEAVLGARLLPDTFRRSMLPRPPGDGRVRAGGAREARGAVSPRAVRVSEVPRTMEQEKRNSCR